VDDSVPADFVLDPANQVVFSRAWGTLTDADLLDHQRRLKAHPDFKPCFNQVFDFESVTQADVTPDGMRVLARGNAFGRDARRAFVVISPLMYGMMRMFEILTSEDPDEFRVQFDNIASARSWLGITTGLASAP
jgi:hypothetical protein